MSIDIEKALDRAFNLGQVYWQQADSESYSQNEKCGATFARFNALKAETVESLATPAVPAEPAGWRLVPIEPTDRMMDFFAGTRYAELPVGKRIKERNAYRAMLAAAPEPALEQAAADSVHQT